MIEERLDREIEVGAKRRIRYSTDLITTDGGHTVTNQRWRYPLFAFDFKLEPGDPDTDDDLSLQAFINLFHVAGGRHTTFRFRDWRDYSAEAQSLGTGDGSTTQFQLRRVYQLGASVRYRKVTRPVAGTVVGYKNGIASTASVDTSTGILTFASAPANGVAVTADFEFDLPVRFENDELEIVALNSDLDQPVDITLLEDRE